MNIEIGKYYIRESKAFKNLFLIPIGIHKAVTRDTFVKCYYIGHNFDPSEIHYVPAHIFLYLWKLKK